MPLELPDRSHFDLAIDPERAMVALDYESAADRAAIVGLAEGAGLKLETGLEPGPSAHAVGRSGKEAVIRIHQDVTVTLDGLELDGDDFVLKQEIRIDAEALARKGLVGKRRRSDVAHSGRMVWLTGSGAVERVKRAIEGKQFKSGVAVMPVYFLPGHDRSLARRYSADPWFVDIRGKHITAVEQDLRGKKIDAPDHAPLPPALERLVTVLPSYPAVGGRWVRAKLVKPMDLYDFAAEFLKLAGDRYRLSIRGLPMLVPLASTPVDADYVAMQRATLAHISAEPMWNAVTAAGVPLSPVKVFYVDVGVYSPGQDIVMDTNLSVYINELNPLGGYRHGVLPATANDHGTQMAGVTGGAWDHAGMAGVAGCFPAMITQVSLRCTSLGDVTDALTYAASTMVTGERGVVVLGLDVLQLYYSATLCLGMVDEVNRFNDGLTAAMSLPNDLVVIAPAGNYDPTAAVPDTAIHVTPPDMSGLVIVGATDQSCTNRLVDLPTRVASKFGAGLTLVAPGANVYTSSNTMLTPPLYTQGWGTSIAAAHVAGIAVLTRCVHPGLRAPDVKQKLFDACTWGLGIRPGDVGNGLINGATAVS